MTTRKLSATWTSDEGTEFSFSDEIMEELQRAVQEQIDNDIIISMLKTNGFNFTYKIPYNVDALELTEWVKTNAVGDYRIFASSSIILFSSSSDYEWTTIRWS